MDTLKFNRPPNRKGWENAHVSSSSYLSSQHATRWAKCGAVVAIFALIYAASCLRPSNKVFKAEQAADTQQKRARGFDKLVAGSRMSGSDYDRDGIPPPSGGATWRQTEYGIGNRSCRKSPTDSLSHAAVSRPARLGTERRCPLTWSTTVASSTRQQLPVPHLQ